MTSIQLQGADQLAATSKHVADQLRAGLDNAQAAEEVAGYITHPGGTPAGVARGLAVDTTPAGFTLSATGDGEPFLTRFLTDPFDARAEAVADQYAEQLEQLLTDLQGA